MALTPVRFTILTILLPNLHGNKEKLVLALHNVETGHKCNINNVKNIIPPTNINLNPLETVYIKKNVVQPTLSHTTITRFTLCFIGFTVFSLVILVEQLKKQRSN